MKDAHCVCNAKYSSEGYTLTIYRRRRPLTVYYIVALTGKELTALSQLYARELLGEVDLVSSREARTLT